MSIVRHTTKDNRFDTSKHFVYGPEEGFQEKGYTFKAFQPDANANERVMVVQAILGEEIVEEILVPMFHNNIFGLDIEDRNAIEAATDVLINALPEAKPEEKFD